MRNRLFLIISWFLFAQARTASAGMPAPLPTDPERIYRLTEFSLWRLQTISFFLLVFLLSVGIVQWLWNYLRHDFPTLPRLSYGKALGAVILWSLLFVIVLTMISGARELMTPGAWKKQGFTYKLTELTPESVRRERLEKLRTALWQFADIHYGRFPASKEEISAVSSELWEVPGAGGIRYLYVSGLSADYPVVVLVYEPELENEGRLVLQSNGVILMMPSEELHDKLTQTKNP